ncbi:MAG TPA: GH1 family beta-glucosidase [Thermoanaerobaculia bacterium]|nr:GH1 family beta-glucosidase [Thermoanaerobaculia bacterium]
MTTFPDGFLWGAATSAYQIEGSPLADGAGASIWHRFAHTPGRIRGGDTGDVACDHYRRFKEDVAVMKELGLSAYRFSIAWGRVFPEGTGRVNQAGLDFYKRLVDALLEAGITPMATLYHWDLPAALDDRGGWVERDVGAWFADYAATCFQALPDIAFWATLNEPWVVIDGGYLHGSLAPGHQSAFEATRATHNLLRAHAAAVEAHRADGKGEIGVVVNIEPKHPATDDPQDLEATKRAEAQMNRAFLEPLLTGRYPEELRGIYGQAWDESFEHEAADLAQPIDWLGINYYTRSVVRHDPSAWPTQATPVEQRHAAHMTTGWEVYPQGLEETLRWVSSTYPAPPLYVTENGAAFYDPPTAAGGRVEDPLRRAYLEDHLRAAARAIASGVDLRGYFVWSLLDNLEWAQGFSQRFGLIHVDFETQKRTLKDSAHWYAGVCRSNGKSLKP